MPQELEEAAEWVSLFRMGLVTAPTMAEWDALPEQLVEHIQMVQQALLAKEQGEIGQARGKHG